jgi:hypothetical protein
MLKTLLKLIKLLTRERIRRYSPVHPAIGEITILQGTSASPVFIIL